MRALNTGSERNAEIEAQLTNRNGVDNTRNKFWESFELQCYMINTLIQI